jgi:putative membrane protein
MTAHRGTKRILTRAGKAGAVAGGIAGLVLASPVGAAAAPDDGPAIVVNRESVQVELHSSGSVDTARLFSQLVINGDGKAVILDPTSGKNIRDLDGFSAPDVKAGVAKYTVDVHGRTSRRTVSDFTKKLPLKVSVEYFMDGKQKKASDLVGKSGILDVRYTIENVSATPTEISYTVAGKTVTKTIDLVTPMVGQLTTTLPSSFTDIHTPRADVAGDGRGGQTLNWTMVLFEPIGAVTQTFGYTARVKDLKLPAARIQAVPVAPNRHPELAFGEKGFVDGAARAGNVAFAGATIDTNLAKLRDGAGQLLDGLTQLSAGATALHEGLAGSAAPGATKLADGLGQADAGGKKLSSGLGQLSDGANQLSAGLGQAKSGSSQLAAGADKLGGGLTAVSEGSEKLATGLGAASAGSEKLLDGSQDLATGAGLTAAGAAQLNTGLQQISAGLDQLADAQKGLPAARAGAIALRAGVDKLLDGTAALGNGLVTLSGGISQLGSQVKLGLDNPTGVPGSTTNPPGTKQAVEGLQQLSGLQQLVLTTGIPAGALAPGSPAVPGIQAALNCAAPVGVPDTTACAAVNALLTSTDFGFPKTDATLAAMIAGVADGKVKVDGGVAQLVGGVGQLQTGLGQLAAGLKSGNPANPGLAEGLDALVAGLTTAVTGVTQLAVGAKSAVAGSAALADGTAKVAEGAGQLSEQGAAPLADGLEQLLVGSEALNDGLGLIATGGAQAVAGVHSLDDGLTKLNAGGKQLAAGASTAAAGSDDLSDGLDQLYSGSQQLADGLDAAADGSGQIADGLDKASAGAVKLEDGAEQLRTQAAVPLTQAGASTGEEYAEHAAIMAALDEKAADGALPYGAPEGGTGTAGYEFTLAAQTASSQDNTTRGIAAIVLLGLASASGFFVRRRVLSQ